MHADEDVKIGDIVRIHVESPQLTVGLPKELNQFHVVQHPWTGDKFGLKTFVVPLLYIATRLEVFHWVASFVN
jgi:hypothetical protein